MTFNGFLDPRANGLTKEGFEELETYCNWLAVNNLSDNEINFIHFAIHRAELNDARHFLNVIETTMRTGEATVQVASEWYQIMRFILNPSTQSFKRADVSGWFDFIAVAHVVGKRVHSNPIRKPEFKKVGF